MISKEVAQTILGYAMKEPESAETVEDDVTKKAEERANARKSVYLGGHIIFNGKPEWTQVKVRDLSMSGMRAEPATGLRVGLELMIDIKGMTLINGRIVWIADNRFGVRFDNEINADAGLVKLAGSGPTVNFTIPLSTMRRPGVRPR